MKQLYRKFLLVICACISASAMHAIGHTVTMTQSNVLCFGGCTGSATATVSGGVGPFTYAWSPAGGNTPTATGLCAGTYTVTVTDMNDGSTVTTTVNITQPPQITVTSSVIHATCGFPNGQVTTTTTGGAGVYTYVWSPTGGTTPTLSNAAAGVYVLTVTDANGCTRSHTVTVGNMAGPVVNGVSASPGSICAGQQTVLTPTVTGGTAPYTYFWTPGNSLNFPTSSTPTASPTVTTTYTFSVTDANGCASSATITIPVSQSVSASIASTQATCNQSNGSLTTTMISGTPPYDFSWSSGDTTQSLSNIPAGQYTLTITDAATCQSTIVSGVSNVGGPSVNITYTPASCANYSNGTAVANVTAPAPITYSWNTVPVQNTAAVSGLEDGIYFVTVTDSAGCVTVDSVTVSALAGNLFMYASATSPSNCNTATGGAICYPQGGTPPYTYQWSNGGNNQTISNCVGGIYNITLTDANGCTLTGIANIGAICANIVTGRVYIDMNQDNVYNAGDMPIVGTPVFSSPYSGGSTDSNGIYRHFVFYSGNISVTHTIPYYTQMIPASGSYTHTFASIGDTISGLDFAYHANGMFQDLYISLASGVARPGFTQPYTLFAENRGTTTVSDTIWFRHDSILTVVSSNPAFDGYTHPEGYWLCNNFGPGQVTTKGVVLQVPTINNGGYLGRQLIANARIEPTATDTSSWDNGDDEVDIIQGAYDPNLKECWSPTMNEYGDIWPADLELDYTIHFQNSGTDTAFTVVVVDTLPAELDIATFRMGASSHPCSYSITCQNDTSILTFTFMNILLPDSNRNEPASHGFLQFTIERVPNLPIGTMILNEAHNYFDFNPAVVTNTDTVTITDPLTITTDVTHDFRMYPNPAQENVNVQLSESYAAHNAVVILIDITGREIARVNAAGNSFITLNTESCSPGMYFVTIRANGVADTSQKLIIE